MDRSQGPPFRKLSDEVDMLSTYELKIHLWLSRFTLVQADPEDDLEKQEKQAALVSEHLPVKTAVFGNEMRFSP
jgi:hypothetical protein